MGRTRAVEALLNALSDEDADVREQAARALGEIPDPQAVKPLIRLLDDEEWDVVEDAAGALGKIKSPAAIRPLVEMLRDPSRHKYARNAAARALGGIGDPRALDALLAVYNDREESAALRGFAIRSVGQTKDPRAVEPLLSAVSEEQENIRLYAILGLGDHAGPECIDALVRVAEDESDTAFLRSVAACALIRTGSPDGIDAAIAVFECNKHDIGMWRPILDILAVSEKPRAYLRAIQALQDDNDLIRKEALRMFVETVVLSPGDIREPTEEDLATILPGIEDPRVVQPLIDLAQDPSAGDWTRQYAKMALEKTGAPRALEFLQDESVPGRQKGEAALPR